MPVKKSLNTKKKKNLPINKDEIVGYVRETTNYEKFKPFKGQRIAQGLRFALLVEVLKLLGGIISPIIVNERMEVIDGMGRFAAAKFLNMPIKYIIVPNGNRDMFVAMNRVQRSLTALDYVTTYQEENSDYLELYKFVLHHDIPVTAGIALLSGVSAHGDSLHGYRRGKFKVVSRALADEVMSYAHELHDYLPYACTRNMLYAIRDGIVYKWYNHENVMQHLSHIFEVPYIPGTKTAAVAFLQDLSAPDATQSAKQAA